MKLNLNIYYTNIIKYINYQIIIFAITKIGYIDKFVI